MTMSTGAAALASSLERVQARTSNLAISANSFASAMTRAFQQSMAGGKQFDDVLKSLALRLSKPRGVGGVQADPQA